MNYKIDGAGEAIVFIHGLSDSLLYWEFLANNLKKDYQVLRIDLRGHGETERGNNEITIDLLCEDLRNLLDELYIENINLVGFSLGSAVALDFTIRYPQMVSSLVLMSGFYKPDEQSKDILSQFKSALNSSFDEFYDLLFSMSLCPSVIENNREELAFLKKFASQTADMDAYIQSVDACLNFDVEDKLSQIDAPTLILAGKYDEILPLSSQQDLKNNIKNSKLVVFDDVKHNLLVGKNKEKILSILKSFIKKER